MDALVRLLHFSTQFFPPYVSVSYLKALAVPLLQTLEMAAGAMLIAIAAGLIVGIWIAARLPLHQLLYGILASFRSIPDLTLAILCVVVVGIGPAAGMLALAIFYTAAVGKIFSDLFLSVDPDPILSLRATGAGKLATALFGHLPLRLPDLLSYGAYEFESAVRASVIVGAVGGGGLGTEIVGTINGLDYRRTATLLLTLILLIAVIDRLAALVKRRAALLYVVLPFAAAAFWENRPVAANLPHAWDTFSHMLPPRLPAGAVHELPRLFGETLEIALGGTFFACLAALPLGLCAARNLSPLLLSVPARRLLESLRAVPEIVWGLLLVTAIGVGPQAGMAALALHSTGALGRLFAESFENVPTAPVYALVGTGASSVATAAFSYVPLALPPMAVHTLFRLEWNIRAATIVGVIGAGGLGQALFDAQQLFHYREMMAYIAITWIIVLSVDSGSGLLRKRWKLMEVTD